MMTVVRFLFITSPEKGLPDLSCKAKDKRHGQLILCNMGIYFSSEITLDIDVFFSGALPIDQLKIEYTKKLKFLRTYSRKPS